MWEGERAVGSALLRQSDRILDDVRRGVMPREDLDDVLRTLVPSISAGSSPHLALFLELLDASPVLRSSIRGLLFADADVDDALQETLLAVSRSLPSLRPDTSVLAWVSGIARNKAKDVLRRKGRPAAPEPIVELPTEVERFTSQWASRADVEGALAELSDKLRLVFVLADVEGFSYDEVADRLDIGRNTVASRLRRARAQLGLTLTDDAA